MVLEFYRDERSDYRNDIDSLNKVIKIIERDCTQIFKDKVLRELQHLIELKLAFIEGFTIALKETIKEENEKK